MARVRPPHIAAVEIPELNAEAIQAALTGEIATALASATGTVDVLITFSDASRYKYPSVPVSLAVMVKSDPSVEGVFEQIRYWPGYARAQ